MFKNYAQKSKTKKYLNPIRFIALSAFVLGLSVNSTLAYYEPNDKSFKDGFEAGLKALEFQSKNDGFTAKLISITKPFALLLNIKDMPLSEVLFLQVLASREGIESHLSEDFLYLGSFEREIDAKDRIKTLVLKFKLEAKDLKIHKNIKEIITYPYLYKNFYENLLQKAKDEGIMIETKVLQKPIIKNPVNVKKNVVKKPKAITFTLKNSKAMAYSSLGGGESDSKNYEEKGLVSKKNFTFEKKIKTNSGETFIKVVGENLYFLETDISMPNQVNDKSEQINTIQNAPCVRLCK